MYLNKTVAALAMYVNLCLCYVFFGICLSPHTL